MLSFFLLAINAKNGCPHCPMPGVSRWHCISKVIHTGHRCLLPRNHWLRYMGVSGKCCPKGYYEGSREEMKAANEDVTALFNSATDKALHDRYEEGNFLMP